MIARVLAWLVGSDLGSVPLDRVTLKQATDFTTREFDGAAAIVSVKRVPAWQVRREKLVQSMQARSAERPRLRRVK